MSALLKHTVPKIAEADLSEEARKRALGQKLVIWKDGKAQSVAP